jgi:hypothetical protein
MQLKRQGSGKKKKRVHGNSVFQLTTPKHDECNDIKTLCSTCSSLVVRDKVKTNNILLNKM